MKFEDAPELMRAVHGWEAQGDGGREGMKTWNERKMLCDCVT